MRARSPLLCCPGFPVDVCMFTSVVLSLTNASWVSSRCVHVHLCCLVTYQRVLGSQSMCACSLLLSCHLPMRPGFPVDACTFTSVVLLVFPVDACVFTAVVLSLPMRHPQVNDTGTLLQCAHPPYVEQSPTQPSRLASTCALGSFKLAGERSSQ
jgi:hypothetical protein